MTKLNRTRLTDAAKTFVVQRLACFGSPKEVSEALMEEYGVQLAPQNVEAYDPRKRAGQHLSPKWRELFEHTRQAFLDYVEDNVPLANKAVRVRELADAAMRLKARGNDLGMADMLERIAKEMGNVHMNWREPGARSRGEPDVNQMTKEEVLAELRKRGVDPSKLRRPPFNE